MNSLGRARRLRLSKVTLRSLTAAHLHAAAGGTEYEQARELEISRTRGCVDSYQFCPPRVPSHLVPGYCKPSPFPDA